MARTFILSVLAWAGTLGYKSRGATVRNRLRELRAAARWSQADLADRLDVSRKQSTIETGRYDPSLPLAFKIAEVFDQSIEALFFPTDHGGR